MGRKKVAGAEGTGPGRSEGGGGGSRRIGGGAEYQKGEAEDQWGTKKWKNVTTKLSLRERV